MGFDADTPNSDRLAPPAVPSALPRLLLDRSGNARLPRDPRAPLPTPSPLIGSTPGKPSSSSSYLSALLSNPTATPQVPSPHPSSASISIPSSLFYGDGCDDDPLRDDNAPLPGEDNPSETQAHLRDRVRDAKAAGLDDANARKLEVYRLAGKRTRAAASKVLLKKTSWSAKHVATFEMVRRALEHAVTLAHPDSTKLLCLFTDASDTHWASVLAQIPPQDLDELVHQQRHLPLAFLSSSFKGSSARWSTAEKEAYAIVASVTRLDYILLRPEGFHLFTDHKNLVYLFAPAATTKHIARHVANKIERWALSLAAYRYTINHISGDTNTWADLLTRWSASEPVGSLAALRCRFAAITRAPVEPSTDFAWPTKAKLQEAQAKALKGGENLRQKHSRQMAFGARRRARRGYPQGTQDCSYAGGH